MTASLRVLYVDDEPDIRQVAKLALELEPGFAVETCASGQEALARLARDRPDLVMLDVMMPRMDGPTTLAALRRLSGCERIPVVFITAKAQRQEIERFRALGATDVIAKPFDPMTLARQVKAIWEKVHA
jgi:two-component system, OmpR family, response regulator